MSLCAIEKINLIFISKKTYYELLMNDNESIYVIRETHFQNNYVKKYGFEISTNNMIEEIRNTLYKITYDGNTINLYVNNNIIATKSSVTGLLYFDASFYGAAQNVITNLTVLPFYAVPFTYSPTTPTVTTGFPTVTSGAPLGYDSARTAPNFVLDLITQSVANPVSATNVFVYSREFSNYSASNPLYASFQINWLNFTAAQRPSLFIGFKRVNNTSTTNDFAFGLTLSSTSTNYSYTSGTTNTVISVPAVNFNDTAIAFDGTSVTVYINAALVGTFTPSPAIPADTSLYFASFMNTTANAVFRVSWTG
jgi:hypothetical protein